MNDMRHIRSWGGEKDRRYYRSTWRTRNSGPNLCGAEFTPQDLGRVNAEATIQHAKLGSMGAIHTMAELCPECLKALEQESK